MWPAQPILIDRKYNREPITLTAEEQTSRLAIMNEWDIYRQKRSMELQTKFQMMIDSQEKALRELKLENRELYNMAVQVGYAIG